MLQTQKMRAEDFSIRSLAEALVPDGREWLDSMDPRRGGFIQEAGDAVDVTAFSNITGQIIYSKIMEAYQREEFVVSRLVDTIPTRFDGEKIAGITGITDDIQEIRPGMPYPALGFGEDYIETPSTTKRGFIVPVTKEAIFFDRTHQILSRAAEVGEILGLNKEKRLLDLVIGAANTYNWRARRTTPTRRRPPGSTCWRQRAGRLDQRRRRGAGVRQHSRPEYGRAGAGQRQPGARLSAVSRGRHAGVQCGAIDYRRRRPDPHPRRCALILPPPSYQSKKAGCCTGGCWPPAQLARRRPGSRAISRGPSPTWRTGRSR